MSKGSKRRPKQISDDKLTDNWNRIFHNVADNIGNNGKRVNKPIKTVKEFIK